MKVERDNGKEVDSLGAVWIDLFNNLLTYWEKKVSERK